MNGKKKKIIFKVLDFIFLICSYMLCDYIASKINLVTGIIVALIIYVIISFLLYKIFKMNDM